MAEARRAHSQCSRSFAKPPGQSPVQFDSRFLDARTVPLHIQQPEGGRRLLHIAQHLTEEGLVLALTDPHPELPPEVSEHRRAGRTMARSSQIGLLSSIIRSRAT